MQKIKLDGGSSNVSKEQYGGITVGALIAELSRHPTDNPIVFGACNFLTFCRVMDKSGVTEIEFNERILDVEPLL